MNEEKEAQVIATYTVKKGDTFWMIAEHFYGLGSKYPIIQDFNRKKSLNPGDQLKIPKLPETGEDQPGSNSARLVKIDIANLEGRKLLQESVMMLNGVSEEMAIVLEEQLKIKSIFDLALSHHFNVARTLVDAGNPLEAAFLQHGFIPGDALRGDPAKIKIEELKNADIAELNFRNEVVATKLQEALKIKSIRDMALWPPYQNARQIMLATFDPSRVSQRGEDPEAPADLIPATGNYPTEVVYYTSVFLDEIEGQDDNLVDLSESGGVSLFSEEGIIQGFTQPAKGGILTHMQSWYAQGVTLGQLLHSLALAPGESTRIAMVDWYRRTSKSADENISTRDRLFQTTQQARSISEITRAVANEVQHGSSLASGMSSSKQMGGAGGGLMLQASGGMSNANSIATNVSRSSGRRDLSAQMNQRILSNTQQFATAERSRRATIVQESFQEEKENLTTRVVTNYNHMHALTVQYYEVVQVYRVKTEVVRAERVLFIPMKPIDFTDPRVFNRYKELLKAIASNDVKAKMDNFITKVSFVPFKYRMVRGGDLPIDALQNTIQLFNSPTLEKIEYSSEVEIASIQVFYINDDSPFNKTREGDQRYNGSLDIGSTLNMLREIRFVFVDTPKEDRESGNRPSCRIKYYFQDNPEKGSVHEDVFYPLVKAGIPEHPEDPDDNLHSKAGEIEPNTNTITVLKVSIDASDRDLIQHLQENPQYSHAIWLSLDTLTLSELLAGYTYKGKRIASQIDPVPIAITGNYLGFRWHCGNDEEEQSWEQEILSRSKPIDKEIPLPSGGVFAEAVLGRFNAAEKLDLTRFWNWQDSPIPIVAPEIAPLTAGGKAEASDLRPGQLGQPAVQIQAAPTLPDPTGMRDIMQAIAISNMFRDMSGQAGAISLAQQGMQTTGEGASHATEQASENLRNYVNMVGDVAKEVIPLVATRGLSAASPSKAGALANLADKMDQGEQTGSNVSNKQAVLSSILGSLRGLLGKK